MTRPHPQNPGSAAASKWALRLGLAAALFGCAQTEAEAPPDAGTKVLGPPALPLVWNRLPLLPPNVRPEGWSEAEARWATATRAYSRGELELASRTFLAAAEALSSTVAAKAALRVSITGRCLAYENAARALRAGGDLEGTRQLLESTAAADPACQNSLALRVSRLDAETSTTSSVAEGFAESE